MYRTAQLAALGARVDHITASTFRAAFIAAAAEAGIPVEDEPSNGGQAAISALRPRWRRGFGLCQPNELPVSREHALP